MYECTDVLTLEPNPNKLSNYCIIVGTISYLMWFVVLVVTYVWCVLLVLLNYKYFLFIRLYGCTDVRMYGCTDVLMCGGFRCMDVRTYGCTVVQTYVSTDVCLARMHGCTDVRMYGCTDVRMYGCR